ncbi:unnamed protein product [Urochloa decumbens]|uniref:GDSL esterase/lipase n=1 Tax=Urochloa decumbens TaxID=240449 RepID=A0ABC9DZ53_9POAL
MASVCKKALTGLAFGPFLLLVLVPPPSGHAGQAGSLSAVFIFGDSTADTGNNNVLPTLGKANFPPYGQDFPGGKATGRFSNGKVIGDMLDKVKALVGEETMTSVISNAIFFTVMGGNDIANNYFLFPMRRQQYDLPSYVDFLISSAFNFTMKLNRMRAKKIGFIGIPPVGCSPSQRTSSKECDPLRNQASTLFNSKIRRKIDQLNAEHNVYGLKLSYLNLYQYLLDLNQQPSVYGFKETSEGCCGSTLFDSATFIAYHRACPHVVDYIYWDGFHPTEKAYKVVIDKFVSQDMKYLI